MIGIVNYDAGNLTSVETALQKLGAEFQISSSPHQLDLCDRLIFPGVGHAKAAMEKLRERTLDAYLRKYVESGRPLLGICLGSQILLEESEEGPTECLGIIKGSVKLFPADMGLKVPHMGWNTVDFQDHHLFRGLDKESSFYFVHSYYNATLDPSDSLGETEYGIRFVAALGRANVAAVQFHPEKSGRPGLGILENFMSWNP